MKPAIQSSALAEADLDGLHAVLGELRAAGWPAPEDAGGDDDAGLDGRDLICDRLLDEVGWLRQCAGWQTHLHTRELPWWALAPRGRSPRPGAGGGRPAPGGRDLRRVAADADELACARRLAGLGVAAVCPDRRAERRRVAERDLDFREFCRRSKLPRSERSWDLFAPERYRRGETDIPACE